MVNGTDSPEDKALESEEKSLFEEKPNERVSKLPPLILPAVEIEKPRTSSTLPSFTSMEDIVQVGGYLGRKHELEGHNKKASNR